MAHARPKDPTLIPPVTIAILGLLLLLAMAVALSQALDKPKKADQVAAVPRTTPASAAPQTRSERCERAVAGALGRLALALRQGGTADHAMAVERQRLEEVEYQAYSTVVNQFMEAEQVGRRQGVAAQVQTVLPQIRRACAETG